MVEENKPEKRVIFGKAKMVKSQKKYVEITELPLAYNLRSYLDYLDKLEEKGVIKKYEDLSDDDNFKFIIHCDGKFLNQDESVIYEKLGLIKPYTENFTTLDSENKVMELKSAEELLDYYMNITLEFTEQRRQYNIEKLNTQLNHLKSINEFIQSVLSNKIDLKKDNKDTLIKFCNDNEIIVKKQGSYDYLFNISILNFTPSKVSDLQKAIKSVEKEIVTLGKKSAKDLWIKDLDEFLDEIKTH